MTTMIVVVAAIEWWRWLRLDRQTVVLILVAFRRVLTGHEGTMPEAEPPA